ncbi:MAG: hypothetical protein ABSG96_25835 [Terracidiphilus sp.]|jgi:hypothetical protein
MELALNLAWAFLAAVMVCLWLRRAPRSGIDRRLQFVALAVLLLILFPVVSVSDDLQAAQNPAEADCLVRRDHACSTPHSMLPHVAAMPLPIFAGLSFAVLHRSISGTPLVRVSDHPALAPIQNRPPPVA